MEDELECVSCHAQKVPVKEFEYFRKTGKASPRLLCELCAGTTAGNAQEYPEQFE
jgi:type VI protein secretion system component Hcp